MKHFEKFSNATPEVSDFSYREVVSLRDLKMRPLRCSPGYGECPWESITPVDKYYRSTIAEAVYTGQPRSIWTGSAGGKDFIYVLWRRSLSNKASARVPWPDYSLNPHKDSTDTNMTYAAYLKIDPEEEQNWPLYNAWNEQLNFIYRVRFLTNNICRYFVMDAEGAKSPGGSGMVTDAYLDYTGLAFEFGNYRQKTAFRKLITDFKTTGASLPKWIQEDSFNIRTDPGINEWEDILRQFFEKTSLAQNPAMSFDYLSLAQPRYETAIKTYQIQNGELKLVNELTLPLTISDFWYEGAVKQDNPALMDFYHLDGYEGTKNLLVASLGCDGVKIFERDSNGGLTQTDSFGDRANYAMFARGNDNPETADRKDASTSAAIYPWEKWPVKIKSNMNKEATGDPGDESRTFIDQNLWPIASDLRWNELVERVPTLKGLHETIGAYKKAKTAFLPTPPLKIIATKAKLHNDTGDTLRLFVPNLGHLNITRLTLEVDHMNKRYSPFSRNNLSSLDKLREIYNMDENIPGQAAITPCHIAAMADYKSAWALGGSFSAYVVNYPNSVRKIPKFIVDSEASRLEVIEAAKEGRTPRPVGKYILEEIGGGEGFLFPKNWAIGYNARDLTYLYNQVTPEINNIYSIPIDKTFGIPGPADNNLEVDKCPLNYPGGFPFLDAVRKKGIGGVAIFEINKSTGKFVRSGGNVAFTQNDRSNPDTRFSEAANDGSHDHGKWESDEEKPRVEQRTYPGKTNAAYDYFRKPDNTAGSYYNRLPYNVTTETADAAVQLSFLKELGANGPGAHPCSDLDVIESGGEMYIVTNGFNAPFYDFLMGKWIDKLVDPMGKQTFYKEPGSYNPVDFGASYDDFRMKNYAFYSNRNMMAEMVLALKTGNSPSISLTSDGRNTNHCGNNLRYLDWRRNDIESAVDRENGGIWPAGPTVSFTGQQRSLYTRASVDPRAMYRFIYHDLAFNGSRFQTLLNPIHVSFTAQNSMNSKTLVRGILGRSAGGAASKAYMNWFSGGWIKSGTPKFSASPQFIREIDLSKTTLQEQIEIGTADKAVSWFGTFHFLVGIGINNTSSTFTGSTFFPTIATNSTTRSANMQGVQINWFPHSWGERRNTDVIYDDNQNGVSTAIDNSIFGGAILNHGGIRVYQLNTTTNEMVFVKNKIGGSYPFYINESETGFRDKIADDSSGRAATYPPELMKNLFRLQGGDFVAPGSVDPYDPDLIKAYKNQVGGGNHYGTAVKIYLDNAGQVQILSGNDRKTMRIMPHNTRDLMNTNFYGPCGAMSGYYENDKLNSMEFNITKSKAATDDSDGWVSCLVENFGLPYMWQPFKYLYHRFPQYQRIENQPLGILYLAAWHPVAFNARGLFDLEQVDGEDILYQADGVFKKTKRGFRDLISRMYYAVSAFDNHELLAGDPATMLAHVSGPPLETVNSKLIGRVTEARLEDEAAANAGVGRFEPAMRNTEYGYDMGGYAGGKVYSIKKTENLLLVGFGSEYEPRMNWKKEIMGGSAFGTRYAVVRGENGEVSTPEENTLRLAVMSLYFEDKPYVGNDHLTVGPIAPGTTKTIGGT